MATKLTEADARCALRDHLAEKARLARSRHGPVIDADAILRVLADTSVVRYPTGLRFDTLGLEPGEIAAAVPLGEHPSRGFCIVVHPMLEQRRDLWAHVVAYHIPPINYGDMAAPEDCEHFGSTLLAISTDEYYRVLFEVADALPRATEPLP